MLGVSAKDAGNFSFVRLMRHALEPESAAYREAAAMEIEICEETRKLNPSDPTEMAGKAWPLPAEVMLSPFRGAEQITRGQLAKQMQEEAQTRVVTAAATGSGLTTADELVATNLLASSFVDLLYAESAVLAYASMMTGLTGGNLSIPVFSTGIAPDATTEVPATTVGSVTPKDPAFGQRELSPKRMYVVGAMSNQAMVQSTPDIEMILRRHLARQSAVYFDRWGINGGGTNEPKGLFKSTAPAVPSIDGSGTGADGRDADWRFITRAWATVAAQTGLNARTRWVMGPHLAGKLMATEKADNTARFIMDESRDGQGRVLMHGVTVSANVPETLSRGGSGNVLSGTVFGDIRQLLMAGWGSVKIAVNPYINMDEGYTRIGMERYVDVAVLQEKSLVKCENLISRT